MDTREQQGDWPELFGQWQAVGRQWADWWTGSAEASRTFSALPLEAGNAALALPLPTTAWVDPAVAARLTEQYNGRFEALWQRAIAGVVDQPSRDAPPHDRRFLAKEWREYPYFAWLKDAYLLYTDYLRELAAVAQADPETKKRLQFMARQYADAIGTTFVRDAGYNRWADAYRLIVLYPQTIARSGWGADGSFVYNPNGCWDWWGYTGADYHTRTAPQIRAVKAMVDRLGQAR